ncbi:MAG: hypothetical protein OEY89_04770 [Gammaproteobacteria bacterium]|nr:hypothetical protein [Gammaproteobacteria bacterium]
MELLSESIIVPRDLFSDIKQVQHLSLLFKQILVWPLDRNEVEKREMERLSSDLEYLASEGIVARCAIEMPISFGTSDGKMVNPMTDNADLILPIPIATNVPEQLQPMSHADRIIRHVASQLVINDAPVTAHIPESNLAKSDNYQPCLEITLKNIPLPPENMPWQDFVQFRKDEENISLLRDLRIWLHKQATTEVHPKLIQEELESLLEKYRKYMALQHKKYGEGFISTVMVGASEAVQNMASLKPTDALKSIFGVRSRNIALAEAELNAPGREISYIAKAQDLVK